MQSKDNIVITSRKHDNGFAFIVRGKEGSDDHTASNLHFVSIFHISV